METMLTNIKYDTTDNLFSDYNEYKDIDWINILHSIYNIPTLKDKSSENIIINNDSHKKKKTNRCTMINCTFKNYKDNLCRLHYNKKHNLLCHIQNCTNIKKKDNLCYKHIKPLCSITYCKCYAIVDELICRKHKKFKIESHI